MRIGDLHSAQRKIMKNKHFFNGIRKKEQHADDVFRIVERNVVETKNKPA